MEIYREDRPTDGVNVGIGSTNESSLSKFITIRVSKEELNKLVGIQLEAKRRGINIGVSTIVRRVFNEGSKTLDLDEAIQNPFLIFQDPHQEAMDHYADHA